MTETAIATREAGALVEAPKSGGGWTRDQIELLKRTVAKETTDDELQMFMYHCQRTGLDPFLKQVHAVKRYDRDLERNVMSIQTGIDGFRVIAERTRRYAPGRETVFAYDKNGNLFSATAYVKKYTEIDGTWHEIASMALYAEFVQKKRDGNPVRMWRDMPHVMLSKVAEAAALRKAFPAELGGMYVAEEMMQADSERQDRPSSQSSQSSQARESVVDAEVMRDEQGSATKRTRLGGCIYVEDVKEISRSKPDAPKPWILRRVVLTKDGQTRSLSTFSDTIAETATAAMTNNDPVTYEQEEGKPYQGKKTYNLTKLERVFYAEEHTDADAGAESGDASEAAEHEIEVEVVDGQVVDTTTGEVSADGVTKTIDQVRAEVEKITGKSTRAKAKPKKSDAEEVEDSTPIPDGDGPY